MQMSCSLFMQQRELWMYGAQFCCSIITMCLKYIKNRLIISSTYITNNEQTSREFKHSTVLNTTQHSKPWSRWGTAWYLIVLTWPICVATHTILPHKCQCRKTRSQKWKQRLSSFLNCCNISLCISEGDISELLYWNIIIMAVKTNTIIPSCLQPRCSSHGRMQQVRKNWGAQYERVCVVLS